MGISRKELLTPLLLNLVMDSIINDMKKMKQYPMGRYNMKTLCYVDGTFSSALYASQDDL